jgi:hypothetical protein
MDKYNSKLITRIGDSLYHWTNYLADVDRVDVLRESAIDYAISEVLEVNKHYNGKRGYVLKKLPPVFKFKFRHPHPFLVKRSVDLYANTNMPKDNELYSEFKYVQSSVGTEDSDECQRYFNDLFRLLLIQKQSSNKETCLFIVAGKNLYFSQYFRMNKRKDNKQSFFKDILSFSLAEEKREITIRLKSFEKYLKRFNEDYTYKPDTSCLNENDRIKTHLAYFRDGEDDFIHVAVWEIEYVSP